MSGSYNRKLYDNCQSQLKVKESVSPGEYSLYSGAHENQLNSDFCSKNSNATISNTWESIGVRTDVESDLLILAKGTNCVQDKHKPCDNSNEPRCNPGVASNPYVCERLIVPTNMVMPKSAGF